MAKKFWFTADYCFTIIPSDGFVYYVTFKRSLKSSVYSIELHYYTNDNFCVPKIKYVTHNQDSVLLSTMMLTQFYVRVCTLLTCGKCLNDRIISLKGEAQAYYTSLIPPLLFIEVLVPSQKVSGHLYMYWLYRFCLFLRIFYWHLGLF